MGDLTREQIEDLLQRCDIVVRRFGDDTDPAHVFVQMPVDRIQALCAMALRALDTGWRSMESAPRDGTRVLVLHPPAFSNEDSRGAVDVATYDDQRHALRAKPFWRWERAYATREEMRRCAPTAWMPLPNWTDVDAAAKKAKGDCHG